MKRRFLYFLFLGLFLFFISVDFLFSSSLKKEKRRSDKDIELFCSKINPENPYCLKRGELKVRRLELKSLIYKDFERFCQINKENKYCYSKKLPSIFTLCTSILSYTSNCKEWQYLKQQELENKAFLYEEIEKFCQKFPNHSLCK